MMRNKRRFAALTLGLIQSAAPQQEDHSKEIALLRRKKEKLLELSLDDIITKQEFQRRNEELSTQLTALETCAENAAQALDIPRIRTLLERELSFWPPINSRLAAGVAEKIIVHSTGDRQQAKLEIHLKTGQIVSAECGKGAVLRS